MKKSTIILILLVVGILYFCAFSHVFPVYFDICLGGTSAGCVDAFLGIMPTLFLMSLGGYILDALILQSIYKKAKHPRPWMAWIPIVNVFPMLQLGGYSWLWIFMMLLPIVGPIIFLVIYIKSLWRVFEMAGYDGALSLLTLIPFVNIIILGIVAWEKPVYPNVKKE